MSNARLLYCTECDKFYTFEEQHLPEWSNLVREYGALCWLYGCGGGVSFVLPQLGFNFWEEA